MKILTLALVVAGFSIAACADDDPIEQVDETLDCDAICDRYQECFDEDYDTDACRDNCTDRADDPDHRGQEDECSECLADEDSCTSAVFDCTDECVGIVP